MVELSNDTIKIIIGAWLRGEHLEDMKIVPPGLLGDYSALAKVLQTERNPIKAARAAKVPIEEVGPMMGYSYEYLYESAMAQVIDAKRAEWLTEHPNAKPEEIVKVVNELNRSWMAKAPELPTLTDQLAGYLNTLDDRKKKKYLPTGLPDLDNMTGGIQSQTLTAIGARPSTGKSAFCLQVAAHVAKHGGKVLFFSLEMSEAQNFDRLIMAKAVGVNQHDLRSGNLDERKWDAVNAAMEEIGELGSNLVFLLERDLPTIEAIIRAEKPDLVVIDQLTQLQDSSRSFQDRRLQFSHMTANLQRICMDCDVAIWLACQLNRAVNQTSKASMDYLKESGSIEEDADMVILLGRDEKGEAERGIAGNRLIDVTVAKNRNGEIGEFETLFMVGRFGFVAIEKPPKGFHRVPEDEETDFDD